MENELYQLSSLHNVNNYGKSISKLHDMEVAVTPTGETEWSYYINEHGFRGSWDIHTDKTKIAFYGCSFTFGMGVSDESAFASVVEKKLGKEQYKSVNFGCVGSSVQRIAKLLNKSLDIVNPSIVVLLLPPKERFLTFDEECQNFIDLMPSASPVRMYENCNNSKYKHATVYKQFQNSDFISIYTDYVRWIDSELRLRNLTSYWSSWSFDSYNIINENISKNNILPMFEIGDFGRDRIHPGINSHKKFAQIIVNKIKGENA